MNLKSQELKFCFDIIFGISFCFHSSFKWYLEWTIQLNAHILKYFWFTVSSLSQPQIHDLLRKTVMDVNCDLTWQMQTLARISVSLTSDGKWGSQGTSGFLFEWKERRCSGTRPPVSPTGGVTSFLMLVICQILTLTLSQVVNYCYLYEFLTPAECWRGFCSESEHSAWKASHLIIEVRCLSLCSDLWPSGVQLKTLIH